MKLEDHFKEDFLCFDVEGNNFEELVKNVGDILKGKDLVTESYLKAVLKRETEFPTGLITKSLNIGLPHTDPEHIKEPFVFIVKTKNPIKVKQMGDNQDMEVENFFFLGITQPTEQVELLQIIMNLFMDDKFVMEFKNCANEQECFKLLIKKLNLKEVNKKWRKD